MLKIASRRSQLARIQVQEILSSIGNPESEIIGLDSFGDLHKELSLLTPQKPDFFTDTVDRSLLDGLADCAVHSAKDLPMPLQSGLEIAALTRCLDPTDALVSKEGMTLSDLPKGARIGTSSAQRKAQLFDIRDDISFVSLRGTIEERLAYIDRGDADAVIVATCALKRLGLESRITEILPFKSHPLQGMLAVVVRTGEREHYARFSCIDERLSWGRVWLVGGGPGAPDLITKKGDHILSRAEVILYDDLVALESLVPYNAQKIPVGKRKGHHSMKQIDICELLYEHALAGKRVVRLKGGDPLIYGRSGEELDYLRERHIPVEIIPGISSMQGAAAELLMPLTKRGSSERLILSTAHRAEGEEDNAATRAVYMGASVKQDVAELLARDTSKDTGVALVQNATHPYSRVELCSVSEIGSSLLESPLMILAGNAVPQNLPQRTLHTGIDPIEPSVGGVIVHWPLIRTERVSFRAPQFEHFDCILLTSRTAADIFFSRFGLTDLPVLAIGKGTREAILSHGGKVVAEPARADSDALNDLIVREGKWNSILYPCSSRSHNALHGNPAVTPLIIYNTILLKREPLDLSGFHSVVFSSPSTVEAFFSLYQLLPPHLQIYSYGPMTVRALIERNIQEAEIINLQKTKRRRFNE